MVIGVLALAVITGISTGGVALYLDASIWMILATYSGIGTAFILAIFTFAAMCNLTGRDSERETSADLAGA